ncbi:hypothetical protein AA313_de0200064 [Arthrobotrys entomopaga]|nr:hypothetical protein AA313_de0200064 [Arthrobotrys entomopaga]
MPDKIGMTSVTAAAVANWPTERMTTSTDPAKFVRAEDVRHLRWVWWSAPYFVVLNGAKVNFHDVDRNVKERGCVPTGFPLDVWARWVKDKLEALKKWPITIRVMLMDPKHPPTDITSPLEWRRETIARSPEAYWTSPNPQVGDFSGVFAPGGVSANSIAASGNSMASGSQATVSSAAAPSVQPTKGLSGLNVTAVTQGGAQPKPVNASSAAVNSQPKLTFSSVVPQQSFQFQGPPVLAKSGGPVGQSTVQSAMSMPSSAPGHVAWNSVAPLKVPQVAANMGTLPTQPTAPIMLPTAMDFMYNGASVALAGPPSFAPSQAPATALISHPPLPAPSANTNRDPLQDVHIAGQVRRWILEKTGAEQRFEHTIVPSEASELREARNTVMHHCYWPHGYLCLYFPDHNVAVEFQREDDMWEDAPRDVDGDVIMG